MEFTPEQQEFFDNKIKEKYTEAYAKAGEKYKADVANAVATAVAEAEAKYKGELDTAKKQITELTEAVKAKGDNVDDSAVVERIAAIEAELKKAREQGITGRLESIGAKLNAVNPEQAAVLVRMQTRTDDDGNLTVVNAEGQPRINAENKPMTIEELFKEFLAANPHHVKASASAGAGSAGATGINTGAAKTMKRGDYDRLTPAAQSEFIKAGGKPVD